jgi:hypothetical protein
VISLAAFVGSTWLAWRLLTHFFSGGDSIMAVLGIVFWVLPAGIASCALTIWLTLVIGRKFSETAKQ